MIFTEDLDTFFDTAEGAELATIAGVPSIAVNFYGAAADAEEIDGTAPAIACIEANLPAGVTQGTAVVVRSTNYVVAEVRPDGMGIVTLKLQQVTL